MKLRNASKHKADTTMLCMLSELLQRAPKRVIEFRTPLNTLIVTLERNPIMFLNYLVINAEIGVCVKILTHSGHGI